MTHFRFSILLKLSCQIKFSVSNWIIHNLRSPFDYSQFSVSYVIIHYFTSRKWWYPIFRFVSKYSLFCVSYVFFQKVQSHMWLFTIFHLFLDYSLFSDLYVIIHYFLRKQVTKYKNMRKRKVEFLRKFEKRGIKISWVILILIHKSINLL